MRPIHQIIGQNVKRIRREQGLSKTTLARMAGITRQFLTSIEKGASDMKVSVLQDLADVLNVEPAVLLIVHDGGEF
ncbi:MAG: helix-turn-helix transcriptional regulator [Eggerthellaceae bacterium]|nr:helix-turn-helix transcriptional regulator [Eggerthellaceae bacterium]